MEPAAAAFAAQRRQGADLDRLDRGLAVMREAGARAPLALDGDLRFHRAVLDAAGNEVLRAA